MCCMSIFQHVRDLYFWIAISSIDASLIKQFINFIYRNTHMKSTDASTTYMSSQTLLLHGIIIISTADFGGWVLYLYPERYLLFPADYLTTLSTIGKSAINFHICLWKPGEWRYWFSRFKKNLDGNLWCRWLQWSYHMIVVLRVCTVTL